MLKALKQELFRLSRSLPLLLAVLLIAVASIARVNLNPDVDYGVGMENYIFGYNSEYQFEDFVSHMWGDNALDMGKKFLGMEDSEAGTLHDLYVDLNGRQYPLIYWYCASLFVPCFLLPTALIGFGKKHGTARLAARLGGSARKVALAKLLIFYAVFLVIDALGVVIQQEFYAPYGAAFYSFGFRLRSFLLRLALDAGIVSIPLWVAFKLKMTLWITVVNFLLAFVFCFISADLFDLAIPFPPFLHGLRALWQPETPLLSVLGAMALGLAWAVGFALLSLRAAEKEYARML